MMKPETKRGILYELFYLSAVVGVLTVLRQTGVIAEDKIWIYLCFLIFLIEPLRRDHWIDFRLFTWRNWKKYLLHVFLLAVVLLAIEYVFF